MKLSLVGIFLLREIIFSQATASTSKYDITTAVNEFITEIFHSIDSNKITECLQFYKGKPEDKKYEIENTRKIFPFGSKVYFDNLEIRILDNLELNLQIRREFLTNKMRIFNNELSISVNGFINLKPNESYTSFTTYFQYKNISIVAAPYSTNGSNWKIQIEFLHDYISNVYFRVRRGFEKISYDEKSRSQNTINSIAPSLIRNHFYTNDQFLQILETIFSRQPKQRIISAHPDFLHDYNQQLYHYFIPTISKFGLNLNNISLRGLSNVESLNVKEMTDHSMYTLLVKKIQGKLTLDHGIKQKKVIELDFTVERILITVDRETKRICVDARDYLFTKTRPRVSKPSWLSKFSNVIMYLLENELAASIMPSMEVWRIHPNELSNDHRMEITIIQMLAEIAQTPTYGNLVHRINEKPEPYNYRISFKDMSIKIKSASPCITKQIRCEFLKNLQINHKIKAIPIDHIETKPGTPIAINFHGNFTSIKLAVINPNDTTTNNTCEFQILNNDDIEVELLPTDNNSTMKKKIDNSLLSTVKERIIRNVVSTICCPIDICDQSLKIIDDYFYRFIDSVMKKCPFRWFRRNTRATTTTTTYKYTRRTLKYVYPGVTNRHNYNTESLLVWSHDSLLSRGWKPWKPYGRQYTHQYNYPN